MHKEFTYIEGVSSTFKNLLLTLNTCNHNPGKKKESIPNTPEDPTPFLFSQLLPPPISPKITAILIFDNIV